MAFNSINFGNFTVKQGKIPFLPDFGLSEGDPGFKTSKTGLDYSTSKQTADYVNKVSSGNPAPYSGDVLGSFDKATSTGGSSGGSSRGSSSSSSGSSGGSSNTIMGYAPDDYYDRLAGAYSGTFDALNKAEQSYRQDYDTQARNITDLYNAQVPQINAAKDNALNVIQDAQVNAEQGSNKALNSARELGGQLTQRANNLFGSGALSGVGQAAQEIYGRELQRNTGDIRQNLVNNIKQLENERVNVQKEADNKIQQVQVNLQQAIGNLQAQLNAALRDVNNMRGEVAGRRDEIALDLMREYRSRARQLQDEARGFAQQIAIETGNANRYLDQLMGQYNEALQGSSYNAMNTSRSVITDALNNSQDFSTSIGGGSNSGMGLITGYRRPEDENVDVLTAANLQANG